MVRLVSAYRDRIHGMKAAHRIYTHIDKGEILIRPFRDIKSYINPTSKGFPVRWRGNLILSIHSRKGAESPPKPLGLTSF